MIGISEGIVLANRYQLVRRQFERGIGAGWVAVDSETSAEVWVQFTRHGGLEAVGELLRRHGHAGMPAVLDTGELRMIVDSSALALRTEGDSHSTHVEIVIEFVVCRPITGRAMTAKVARKPLTPSEALLAVAGLAEALELALQEGYSHGWLTGESVWITRRGACALDLALGLCASDEMAIEVEQEVTGCFGPERLSGGPATEAADIALGWLLYSLLIGYAGLQIEYARVVAEAGAATTVELLARWRKRARRHIIELLGADSALAALLVAALAESAEDRPTLSAFHPGARAAAGDLAGVAALLIPLPAAHSRTLGPGGVAAVGAGVLGAAALGAAVGFEAAGIGAEGESISGTGATEGTETISGEEAGGEASGEAAGGSGVAGLAAAGAAGAFVGFAAESAEGGAGSGAAGAGGTGAAGASGAGGAGGAAAGSGGAAGGAGSASGGAGGAAGGSGVGAGASGASGTAGAVGAAGGASAGYAASSLGQVGIGESETGASESATSESELSESARRWRRKVLASSAASCAAVLVVGIVIGYLWGHSSSTSTVTVAATPATVVVTVTVTVPGLNAAGTPTSALVGTPTTPTASSGAGSGATPTASSGGGSGGGATPAAGAYPVPTSDTQALSQMSQAVRSAGSAGQITSSTESTFQNAISSTESQSKGSTGWWNKVHALSALIQSSQQQGTIPTGLANQLTGIVNYLNGGGGS